jgi:hypothetical protein
MLSAVGQEGNILTICCSSGLFIILSLKGILTAIAYRIFK